VIIGCSGAFFLKKFWTWRRRSVALLVCTTSPLTLATLQVDIASLKLRRARRHRSLSS
jgi:hypothetical protein